MIIKNDVLEFNNREYWLLEQQTWQALEYPLAEYTHTNLHIGNIKKYICIDHVEFPQALGLQQLSKIDKSFNFEA